MTFLFPAFPGRKDIERPHMAGDIALFAEMIAFRFLFETVCAPRMKEKNNGKLVHGRLPLRT